MASYTFDGLIADLTRDAGRAQPKDALQYCATWFQTRLEEQRSRTRDYLARHAYDVGRELPSEIFQDQLTGSGSVVYSPMPPLPPPHSGPVEFSNPFAPAASRQSRGSIAGPFGRMDSPGHRNSLHGPPPTFQLDGRPGPPADPYNVGPGNYLSPSPHHPASAIFARRSSISAESILVDSIKPEHLPVYPKSPEQLERIRASISNNFIFRDLDEEQATGVLNAMQEKKTVKGEVVIRQGDVGDFFYVVESGLLHCYIRSDPLPPAWNSSPTPAEDKFLSPGYHSEFGKQVAECTPGTSFGELALMYGHLRAASVVCVEDCTLWSLDRITFRSIILKAAHRRRTMYEDFLSQVTLLSSLTGSERSKIADALVSKVYQDGEAVVKQGEMGDTFFFVEEGEAVVTKALTGEDGQTKEVAVNHYKKGGYFGELSLLTREPRAATVSAVQRADPALPKLKVAALDAVAFTRLLGPLRDLMERRAGEIYGKQIARPQY
ncbi:camp-dependent protein kinase regulatory subunit [Cylindrobasidium torrendii FP15055 ss-10]|uniref:cAMP-dependent protein kinase regulatory subunit n=1 Tax=Cylindrobasidium torrendii FP15055 ss-10 TaxID=1314674 RepID=A0A0D7BUA6_9AGAR|nr:camp-dependent protein kinase regulatory subunit [Cylindrobasidium torrendii FP15055 ss-10]